MGRSNIKQVADKRVHDIKKFLQSLFMMADEICHSDLVYTFFHPLLRDQQESSIHEHKLKGKICIIETFVDFCKILLFNLLFFLCILDQKKDRVTGTSAHIIKGQIKLSLHYQRETLWVCIKEIHYVVQPHNRIAVITNKILVKECL